MMTSRRRRSWITEQSFSLEAIAVFEYGSDLTVLHTKVGGEVPCRLLASNTTSQSNDSSVGDGVYLNGMSSERNGSYSCIDIVPNHDLDMGQVGS